MTFSWLGDLVGDHAQVERALREFAEDLEAGVYADIPDAGAQAFAWIEDRADQIEFEFDEARESIACRLLSLHDDGDFDAVRVVETLTRKLDELTTAEVQEAAS